MSNWMVRQAVLHALDDAWIRDAGGQPLRQAEPMLDLAQRQQSAVGGEEPTIEAGDDRLARDR